MTNLLGLAKNSLKLEARLATSLLRPLSVSPAGACGPGSASVHLRIGVVRLATRCPVSDPILLSSAPLISHVPAGGSDPIG